ncbi:hypothetical protein INR49_030682, partial [Caranx melampygus]
MRTLLLSLLVLLCVSGTLQKKGAGKRKRRNSTGGVVPVPRIFIGVPVLPTEASNGTPASNLTQSPLNLHLRSNDTAKYLDGPVSTGSSPSFTRSLPFPWKPLGSRRGCLPSRHGLFLWQPVLLGPDAGLHQHQALPAVVHPFWYKTLPKRMCTAWVTLAMWAVFGAAIIPEFLIQQTYRLPELDRTTCHDVLPLKLDSHKFLLYYNLILTIFGLLLPLVVTIFCYVQIVRELNQSHLDWMMYIKASSLVFTIFLLCFTPAGVLHLLHY